MTLEERFSYQLLENEKQNNTRIFALVEQIDKYGKGYLLTELVKENFVDYEIDIENDTLLSVLPKLKRKSKA